MPGQARTGLSLVCDAKIQTCQQNSKASNQPVRRRAGPWRWPQALPKTHKKNISPEQPPAPNTRNGVWANGAEGSWIDIFISKFHNHVKDGGRVAYEPRLLQSCRNIHINCQILTVDGDGGWLTGRLTCTGTNKLHIKRPSANEFNKTEGVESSEK